MTQQISGRSGDVAQGTQVGGIWLGQRMSNDPKTAGAEGEIHHPGRSEHFTGVLTLASRPVHTWNVSTACQLCRYG